MKSIFKLSALALLATALTVSCEKEMAVEDVVAHQMESHTFTLAFAQPDTKVAVTNEGKTTWEVGDEIMIHGGKDGALRQKVTLTADDISADGKKATITFEMDPYDRTDAGVVSKFYAQYPASLVPEGNMYYECRFTATNDFLMAACDVNDTFVFYNLCGIIAFKAEGEFDNFAFEGNNGEVVGYSSVYQVRVRLDNGKDAPSVNYNKPGNGSGDPVPMKSFKAEKKDGVNYIFLPAGAKFSGGFTFKFYDGTDLVKIAKTEKAVEVGPSKILYLDDISDKLEDFVPPTTSDHKPAEWAAAAVDLSYGKQAPANCYVLTAPGVYQIPALKGNSTDPVGNVFDVELVWETYNNETEVVANSIIADVDFDNDNLYFKTPDALKPGNALIAAKDFDGKILWSWHIWIPETAIGTVDGSNICNAIVMDRNLGALRVTEFGGEAVATVESYGLMYQWGRKDPFPGPKRVDSSTLALIAGTPFVLKDQSKEEYVSGDTVKGSMTQTEATQNPTVFGNYGSGDWDEAANADRWTREGKTIYDPCPAGYMVMKRESSSVLWNTTNIATAATEAGMTWASSLEGHWFSITDASGNALAFPLAGYIDDCDVKTVPYIEYPGKRAAVYAAYLSSGSPYHLNIREDKTDYHKAGSTSAARGATVRCVKIDGWVEPTQPEPEDKPAFVRVTSNDEIADGVRYLFVYEAEGKAFNGGLETLDVTFNTIDVTIEEGKIAADDATLGAVFTFDLTNGTIKSASGFFISNTSGTSYSNGLKQSAEATTAFQNHSITINEAGNVIAQVERNNSGSVGHMILNFNANSSDKRFRYYKEGNQKQIHLYRYEGDEIAPATPKQPAVEHLVGWYSGDNLWGTNVTAINVTAAGYGMVRGIAMDDEYIYMPKASAYPAIAAVKISDPTTQVAGDVSTVDAGDTFKSSFVRMMKNTDANVNGGKDILLMSNCSAANGGNIVIYAYTNGISAAPIKLAQFAWDSVNNVEDWRRYGDRFFVTGTWQNGKIWLPSFAACKVVVLSVANGARTAVEQFEATEDVLPEGIKDLTIWEGTDTQYLVTNNTLGNMLAPGTGTGAHGWTAWALNYAEANAVGTWGYNFFEFNGEKYIAYARLSGKKAWVEVIKQGVNLGRSIAVPQVAFKIPILSATDVDAEQTADVTIADCSVRVIGEEVYIAALTRDGGFTLDKIVMK